MKVQFKVTFKAGTKTVAEVLGREQTEAGTLTIEDVVTGVLNTEKFLERLTGLRVHIEQVN